MAYETIIVDLVISPDEWLRTYRGEADRVYAYTIDGRSVQFPARILARFVTRDGIRGRFQIEFDSEGKFQRIEQL